MKKLFSTLLALVMLAAALAAAIPVSAKTGFSDVEDDRWSLAPITYTVNKGYMNGVGGGKFDPEGFLTRAMVATVLWRRQGSPAPSAPSGFTDVPDGEWYTDAVAWAKETGVVKGLTETTFGPDESITREQLATMLFRFSSTAPVSVPERADLTPFTDDEKVSDWAAEPLEWAVQASLIKGTDGNRLDPEGNATREQFAAVIQRYDGTFRLEYNMPVIQSHYTEKEYPLVEDADIYVSTDGDDANPGTFEAPLATFQGAVAKVREIKAAKTEGDIVVAFKAGNYGPIEAELTAGDGGSPDRRIIYCKYGDGDVIFDNGVTIEEDEFEPLSEDERAMFQDKRVDKIKKVDLSSRLVEIPGSDNFALFSGDGLVTLARYPDKYDDGSDHFIPSADTIDTTTLYIRNAVMAKRFAAYPADRIPEILIYGYIVRGYRKDTFTLESYDAQTRMLTVGYGSSGEYDKKLRYENGYWWCGEGDTGILMFVFNAAYELDHKGEYWVDRSTGTLYVYDPHGSYHIPLSHGELKVRGINYDTGDGYPNTEGYCAIFAEDTGYITFRGLTFTNTVGEFIIGYKTSGFEIDRCSFSCCSGKNQLLFIHSLPDEPLGLRVTDSEFDNCTGRHVFLYDEAKGPGRFTNRTDALVDNCLFSRSNLTFDAEGAVNLHACSGGLVSHNRFENCSRYGVMFTDSCDVIVEYNDFDSAMCNSDDGGVTRGCGDVLGNNIVRYNFYNTISAGSVGHYAHYADNGDCGTQIYSNLMYHSGPVCFAGAGRDNLLRDNVMIEGLGATVSTFTYNMLHDMPWGWVPWITNDWNRIKGYCETVPGYYEDLIARRPTVANLKFDMDDILDKDFYVAPTNTLVGNLFINAEGKVDFLLHGDADHYCTVEDNVAYTYDENPVFVNPTVGDYRIREGVDFPDIHFENIGRY